MKWLLILRLIISISIISANVTSDSMNELLKRGDRVIAIKDAFVSDYTFIPKYHSLPFFVWCISESHLTFWFFVDLGTAIRLASTIVPSCIIRPALSRHVLTSAKIFSPSLFVFSIYHYICAQIGNGLCIGLE